MGQDLFGRPDLPGRSLGEGGWAIRTTVRTHNLTPMPHLQTVNSRCTNSRATERLSFNQNVRPQSDYEAQSYILWRFISLRRTFPDHFGFCNFSDIHLAVAPRSGLHTLYRGYCRNDFQWSSTVRALRCISDFGTFQFRFGSVAVSGPSRRPNNITPVNPAFAPRFQSLAIMGRLNEFWRSVTSISNA